MKRALCLAIALLAVCGGYAADNEYDTVDVYNVVTIRSSPAIEMRSELVLAQYQKEPNAYLVFFDSRNYARLSYLEAELLLSGCEQILDASVKPFSGARRLMSKTVGGQLGAVRVSAWKVGDAVTWNISVGGGPECRIESVYSFIDSLKGEIQMVAKLSGREDLE